MAKKKYKFHNGWFVEIKDDGGTKGKEKDSTKAGESTKK